MVTCPNPIQEEETLSADRCDPAQGEDDQGGTPDMLLLHYTVRINSVVNPKTLSLDPDPEFSPIGSGLKPFFTNIFSILRKTM